MKLKAALILFLLFFATTGATVVLSQNTTAPTAHQIAPHTIGDQELLQGEPIDGPSGPH